MNERSGTAPANGRDDTRRLVLWLLLVAILIAIGYAARGSSSSDSQLLYHWSTAAGAIIQDGIILGIVLAIAGRRRDLLALRRPVALAQAGWILVGAIVAVYIFEGIYSALTHPGNEQGLTPSHWEPHRATQYVVNAIVICTFVPFVEELMYRGLGYSVLQQFGKWPAIIGVGVLFGLAHGLLLSLPILIGFGCILAWIRSTTRSVFPGMVLHGTFNLIALIAAVTLHR